MLIGIWSNAQEIQISGKVTSTEDGSALPGVSVVVKGATTGTTTNVEGAYTLLVPADATIVFTFIGMKEQELVVGGQTTINVEMAPEVTEMQEVIVTALGITREKKNLGYAVQDVKGENITKVPNANMLNSLNGKISGVQVTSSSGAAGSASYITIRGNASITGSNQPLFIVDGVPIDNSMNYSGNPDNGNNNLLDGVNYSNRAIDLNPDDIESISVLKGGAATALYGIRAANGVIMVTTKKGKAGDKVKVTITSSVTFDKVNKLPELQNKFVQGQGGEWMSPETHNRYSWGPNVDSMYWDNSDYAYDKHGVLVGQSDPSAAEKFEPYDNLGTFFQTGITFNNSITASGGSETSSFYVSGTQLNTTGIIPNNTYKKTSFKITGDSKLGKRLTILGSANFIKSGGDRIQQGSNLSGVMLCLLRTPISFDNSNGYDDPVNTPEAYMFSDGTPRSYRGQLGGSAIYDNPYWTVNKNIFTDDVNRIIGYAGFNLKIFDWMTLQYKLGNDFSSDRRNGHFALYSGAVNAGRIQLDNHTSWDLNSDLILNMSKQITSDITANVMVGNNMFQSTYEQLYVQGDGLTQPDFYNLSNASSILSRQYNSKYRTAAFYGSADINYKGFANLNFTGRQEWSTTLPSDNNSFFFPSASASFIFSELSGLKGNNVLSFGKLRASIAKTANDAGVYMTKSNYNLANYGDGWTPGISFPFEGYTGFMWGNGKGNPDLKPEFSRNIEAGIDVKVLNNRIGLGLTYFDNKSTDLILFVPVASTSGYNEVAMNAASMENKGIEITADAEIIKVNDFGWQVGVNFSKIKNEVLELAPGVDNVFLGGFEGAQIRAVKGFAYGSMFGTQFEKDANGNVVIDSRETVGGQPNSTYGYPMLSSEENSFGSSLPDWTAGFNSTISYKGVSLYALLDIKKGGIMWNGTRGALVSFGMAKETEDRGSDKVLEGLKSQNDGDNFVYDADGKIMTSGANDILAVVDEGWYNGVGGGFSGPSEPFIEKTDWVRLREVSLAYSLPSSIFEKTFIKALDISLSAHNLWLNTDYKGVDPETNLMGADNAQGIDYFNMPNTKSYTIGIKLLF